MTRRPDSLRRSRGRPGVPMRARRGRRVKRTILIVGEGQETEPNYFRGLVGSDLLREDVSVVVKKGPGWSADAVVKEAIGYKNQASNRQEAYDEVWCVLDVETLEKRDALQRAISLAKAEGITLCLSNPCFEVWFIAHFVRQSRPYPDADQVVEALNKHWRTHFLCSYEKGDDQVFRRVEPRTRTALQNARLVRETDHAAAASSIDANSSTEVYRLVERLLKGVRCV